VGIVAIRWQLVSWPHCVAAELALVAIVVDSASIPELG
jgi:hypothetical protein